MNQDDPDFETMFAEADREHLKREASILKSRKDKDKSYYQEHKRANKPEFNRMVKKRRAKAKYDAKAKKANRKKK